MPYAIAIAALALLLGPPSMAAAQAPVASAAPHATQPTQAPPFRSGLPAAGFYVFDRIDLGGDSMLPDGAAHPDGWATAVELAARLERFAASLSIEVEHGGREARVYSSEQAEAVSAVFSATPPQLQAKGDRPTRFERLDDDHFLLIAEARIQDIGLVMRRVEASDPALARARALRDEALALPAAGRTDATPR